MSKIGKKILTLPDNVELNINNNEVIIKGPKGILTLVLPQGFSIEQNKNKISVIPPSKIDHLKSALWGTSTALIQNNIIGVTEGFEKKLEIEGVGYKAEVNGNKLTLNIGYSHPVFVDIPEGIEVSVVKNVISIKGISKQNVGDFAANVRKLRKTNPYSGKGIHYQGEHIIRKTGKKVASSSS